MSNTSDPAFNMKVATIKSLEKAPMSVTLKALSKAFAVTMQQHLRITESRIRQCKEGCECLDCLQAYVDSCLDTVFEGSDNLTCTKEDPPEYPRLLSAIARFLEVMTSGDSKIPTGWKDPDHPKVHELLSSELFPRLDSLNTARRVQQEFKPGMTFSSMNNDCITRQYVVVCTLKDSISHGSFNQGVNLVQDLDSGQVFAQKLLPPRVMQSDTGREIGVLAGLNHPNITLLVQYSLPVDPLSIPFVVMEYAEQGTLGQLIEHFPEGELVPEAFLWHVFESLAKAIRYCHYGMYEAGDAPYDWDPVFHRDIILTNIFLASPEDPSSQYSEIKLGDFGCGVSQSELAWVDEYSLPSIDYTYAPPEFWYPDRYVENLGPADIYQIGFSMAYLMHCTIPNIEDAAIQDRGFYYSEDLESLISCCLSMNPKERPDAKNLVLMIESGKAKARKGFRGSEVSSFRPLPRLDCPT
jgi:hypothetical protein